MPQEDHHKVEEEERDQREEEEQQAFQGDFERLHFRAAQEECRESHTGKGYDAENIKLVN